jgi:thiamine-phosphate pyrophosphorylase
MKNRHYALMYVTDDRITDDQRFLEVLEAALKGGVTIVQLREKTLDTKPFYERAVQAKALCDRYGVPFIINDRIDIALAVDADGVHLGQKDMPVTVARQLVGKDKIIGWSVSNAAQALEANGLEVDYIGLSPIFGTATKTSDLDPPLGIEGLRELKQISQKRIVSIGGIHRGNAKSVIQNGSAGIAVVSAISQADAPERAAKELNGLVKLT